MSNPDILVTRKHLDSKKDSDENTAISSNFLPRYLQFKLVRNQWTWWVPDVQNQLNVVVAGQYLVASVGQQPHCPTVAKVGEEPLASGHEPSEDTGIWWFKC